MYNTTSNVLLLITNFTEISDNTGYTGSVVLSSSALASEWAMPMRVVYSYYTGQARTAVTTTANATATLPTWLPIIIIIAIAVIILGLVIRMKVVGSDGYSGPAQFDEYK
jgi:CHASE3 domain sensor protein